MKRIALNKVKEIKDTHLENLEPETKEYRIPCGSGLYFRVSPTGKKSWQVRFKTDANKWKWHSIGSYPQLLLTDAKLETANIFIKLRNKEAILTKKQVDLENVANENLLFKNLVYQWLDTKKVNWAPKIFQKELQSIEKRIIPQFGHRDYSKITPQEWLKFFQNILRTESIFNRVKKLVSHCRCAYDFAKFQGYINSNPLDGISNYLDKASKGNMKHIALSELPNLIRSIRAYGNASTAIGLELLIILFPRPQELRFAKWKDFDFNKKLWIKPAETMKCGIQHVVPLPEQAISLLNDLKEMSPISDYLFPSRDSLNIPISEATFNKALIYLGYHGKQTPHGFRHIASTALNEKFSNKEQVIEACLAHKKRGVKAVYDKSIHLGDRIEVMQWWADHLEQICPKQNKISVAA